MMPRPARPNPTLPPLPDCRQSAASARACPHPADSSRGVRSVLCTAMHWLRALSHTLRAATLIAIPFLLLSASDEVRMLTRVERDGSGLRAIWVTSRVDRAREVRTRLREATADWQVERAKSEGGKYFIMRSWRGHSLNTRPDAKLEVVDFVQSPLSLFSTYKWRETVKIYRGAATEVEQAGAQQAVLEYVLQMPGRIVNAGGTPPQSVTGGRAVWRLSGDKEEYVIEAQSRLVRWDLCVLYIYVLFALIYWAANWAIRRIKSRPRRI